MFGARRLGGFITPEQVFGNHTVQKLASGKVPNTLFSSSHFGALILQTGEQPLTICRLEFQPEPAREFFTALKVARCYSLTFLKVPLGNEEMTPLFPILLDSVMNHQFIEELSLNHCALRDEHGVMIAERLKSSALRKLDLSHNFIEEQSAIQIGHSIGKLDELNLSKNRLDERISRLLRSHPGCKIIVEE